MVVTLNVEEPGTLTVKTIRVPIKARGIMTRSDGEHSELDPAPFAVPVPVPKGTTLRTLRIEDSAGHLLSDEIIPTPSTPTVAIVSPKLNEQLGAKTTIAWVGSDKDTGSTLTYQVAYSPNDGLNFIPVAVGLEKTSLTIDTTVLPKTEDGRGLLRVFVHDGFNTSYVDVRGLSQAQ